MSVFVFEVQLLADIRVEAPNEAEAQAAIARMVITVRAGEATISATADGVPYLFEVDGKAVR